MIVYLFQYLLKAIFWSCMLADILQSIPIKCLPMYSFTIKFGSFARMNKRCSQINGSTLHDTIVNIILTISLIISGRMRFFTSWQVHLPSTHLFQTREISNQIMHLYKVQHWEMLAKAIFHKHRSIWDNLKTTWALAIIEWVQLSASMRTRMSFNRFV
jgi:hypothetical protein